LRRAIERSTGRTFRQCIEEHIASLLRLANTLVAEGPARRAARSGRGRGPERGFIVREMTKERMPPDGAAGPAFDVLDDAVAVAVAGPARVAEPTPD